MSKFPRAALVAGLSVISGALSVAQERELPIDRVPSKLSGFRIRSAWLGGGKYNFQRPSAGGIVKTDLFLGSVGAALNWTHNTDRTNYWSNYAGEFSKASKNSSLDAVNQGFDLGFFRRVAPRWTWRTFGEGEFLSFGSRVFRFPGQSRIPGGRVDAATFIGSAPLSDPTLSTLGRGASDPTSLLVGNDYYRLAVSSSLSFAPSARTSWTFSGIGQQTVYKAQNNSQGIFVPLRRSTDGSGTLTLQYKLNPRTVLHWETLGGNTWAGFNASSGRSQFSRAQSLVQISRTFTTHWFGSAGGGVSSAQAFTASQSAPWFVTYIASGSAGYVRDNQSFLANVSHSAGDSYGFGAQDNTLGTVIYSYRPINSDWGFNLGTVYQRFKLGGRPKADGWIGMAGLSRCVTRSTFLFFEVAQTSNVSFSAGRLIPVGASRSTLDTLAQSAFRVSFVYQPRLQVSR